MDPVLPKEGNERDLAENVLETERGRLLRVQRRHSARERAVPVQVALRV
jgi:hypothetical protein